MSNNRKLSLDELKRKTIEENFLSPKMPVVVVIDNVRSLNNIGSIFRTSDALGVEQIIICGFSGTPPNREIHRTALGAEESVRWQYFESTIDAVNALKMEGYTICSIEQTAASKNIRHFFPERGKKYAIVFGNEVKGVEQSVIDLSDLSIEIPQFGTKHSFNVAVTAGIVIWDFYTKLISAD
jgi:tRNA G18 (ribose-2'-O)-methylase SpoU